MSCAERLSDIRVNGSDDMGLNMQKALQWYHKTQAYMGRDQKLVIDKVHVVFLVLICLFFWHQMIGY